MRCFELTSSGNKINRLAGGHKRRDGIAVPRPYLRTLVALSTLTLVLLPTALLAQPDQFDSNPEILESVEVQDKTFDKTVTCSSSGTGCTGLFHDLFHQVFVSHLGRFWVQPQGSVLTMMEDLGMNSSCVAINNGWFQVMPDDGDGGETYLRNSIRIADLTNRKVRFDVYPVSGSDNTCRIISLYLYEP